MSLSNILTGSPWNLGNTSITIHDLYTVNVNGTPYSGSGGPPTGSIIPALNSTYTLGDSSFKYLGIYGTNLYGQIRDTTQNHIVSLPNCDLVKGSSFFNTAGVKSIFTDLIGGQIAEGYGDQPNIHSIGALSASLITRDVIPTTTDLYALGTTAYTYKESYINSMYGTITTAAQPNITSLGTLTGLTMSGNINSHNITPITGSTYSIGDPDHRYSEICADLTNTVSLKITSFSSAGKVLTVANTFGNIAASVAYTPTLSTNTIISRDGSGGFEAGAAQIQTLQINTMTTDGILHNDTSGVITSSLIVDSDIDSAAAIANSKLAGAPDSANTYNTIVLRDVVGGFSCGKVNMGLLRVNSMTTTGRILTVGDSTGNIIDDIAYSPNNFNNQIVQRDAGGSFTATTVTANLVGNVTGSASLNLLKTGGTLTGSLTVNNTITQNSTTQNNLVLNNTSAWNSIYFNNGSHQLELGQKTSTDSYIFSSTNGGSYLFYFDSLNNPIFYNNIKPVSDGAQNLGNGAARLNTIFATNPVISTSDRNEKENIINCDLGLSFINALAPKIYKYKDTVYTVPQHDGTIATKILPHNRNHVGLIAQDVEQALIDIARPTDPLNVDGVKIRDLAILSRDTDTGKYGLRYCELIPILINAVKELKKILDDNNILAI